MHIEDYGFLSDTETAALVSRDGSMDWLCMPRFDAPACFAKLIGTSDNGFWKIAPQNPPISIRRSYRRDTLVLDTEFETGDGCVRLTDFMPPRNENPCVVRIVQGVRGTVEMEMRLVIRFLYGKIIPWVRRYQQGIVAVAGLDALTLRSDVQTHGEQQSTVARFVVSAGESQSFVLTSYLSYKTPPQAPQSEAALRKTEKFWKRWAAQMRPAIYENQPIRRSLLTLKGLTFAPSGGIVAAATTSLPECLGGERNWDYRFCWLRDATFTLYSLLSAGYTDEATAWCNWLLRAIAGDPAQMQTLYGPAGERLLHEYELSFLSGFEHSQPVRVGNAASEQFQLDVYGEVIDMLYHARQRGLRSDSDVWQLQRHLIQFVVKHWNDPDEGIWEVRGERRHFTHSKVMAWVALDRAIKTCEKHRTKGETKLWRSVRKEIHSEICARSFNKKRDAFTQSFESERLDASTLLIPLVGFLPPNDPRVLSTIKAIEKELMFNGFVMRYDPEKSAAVDGLRPGEGAFLPCSFWLVDCLHLSGRHEEALELFQRLLSIRNDLGLLSEEYDTTQGRLIGNFPQAFSHVALINSATNLISAAGPAMERGVHNCRDTNHTSEPVSPQK
ncbi:MAG: glucoamylase [Verrucomicrobia bacterium]|nr:MAG: glucoamylase [Verrucomicrobiota bacterium]